MTWLSLDLVSWCWRKEQGFYLSSLEGTVLLTYDDDDDRLRSVNSSHPPPFQDSSQSIDGYSIGWVVKWLSAQVDSYPQSHLTRLSFFSWRIPIPRSYFLEERARIESRRVHQTWMSEADEGEEVFKIQVINLSEDWCLNSIKSFKSLSHFKVTRSFWFWGKEVDQD